MPVSGSRLPGLVLVPSLTRTVIGAVDQGTPAVAKLFDVSGTSLMIPKFCVAAVLRPSVMPVLLTT